MLRRVRLFGAVLTLTLTLCRHLTFTLSLLLLGSAILVLQVPPGMRQALALLAQVALAERAQRARAAARLQLHRREVARVQLLPRGRRRRHGGALVRHLVQHDGGGDGEVEGLHALRAPRGRGECEGSVRGV